VVTQWIGADQLIKILIAEFGGGMICLRVVGMQSVFGAGLVIKGNPMQLELQLPAKQISFWRANSFFFLSPTAFD
jgi:hypothetical protein